MLANFDMFSNAACMLVSCCAPTRGTVNIFMVKQWGIVLLLSKGSIKPEVLMFNFVLVYKQALRCLRLN